MAEWMAEQAVCEIVGGERSPGNPQVHQIWGTAFCLGDNFFLTAAHCLKGALSDAYYGVASRNPQGRMTRFDIPDYDLLESLDLALFRVTPPVPRIRALRWRVGICPALRDVMTVGYPFAWDPEKEVVTTRAFKGYSVTQNVARLMPAEPPVYELSFQAPRGLSGSPLISLSADPVEIVGVIVGNSSTEMEVYRETEIISADKEETFVKVAAMSFGIAITADAILEARSTLLGGSVGDFLRERGLLAA